MTYRIVPRTEFGLPAEVRSSGGSLRPPLHDEPWITGHYTGVNVDYTSRVTTDVVLQIQRIFSASKPFEYNYVIGQEPNDEIYEFAGKFRAAHSGGENSDAFGVLFLLGTNESITDVMIDKWKWLRDVLIADGSLRSNVAQRMHFQMPGAATSCPGDSIKSRWNEMLTPWEEPTAAPIVKPPTPEPTPNTEDEDMKIRIIEDPRLGGRFALVCGQWVPWLWVIPEDAEVLRIDHPWTRAQILDHQGPDGLDAWVRRSGTTLQDLVAVNDSDVLSVP